MLNFVRYGYGMYIVKPTVININASNVNNNAASGLYITGTMYNSSIIVGNALMNGYYSGYGVNLAASGANEYSNNNTIIIGNTSGNSTEYILIRILLVAISSLDIPIAIYITDCKWIVAIEQRQS